MAWANKLITLSVSKTTNGKPKFNFKPPVLEVDAKERVVWSRAKDSPVKFEFAALAFNERNPFSSVVVHKNNNTITALDYYYGEGVVDEGEVAYDYSVFIKDLADNTYINSADCQGIGDGGGPTIRNK